MVWCNYNVFRERGKRDELLSHNLVIMTTESICGNDTHKCPPPIKLCERYPPDWDTEGQWQKCNLCDGYFIRTRRAKRTRSRM